MAGTMDEGMLALCRLEVFNEFFDSIADNILAAVERGERDFSLEVTDYAGYCTKLLANNGWSQGHEVEVLNFIWEAVPATILVLMGLEAQAKWRAEVNLNNIFIDITILNTNYSKGNQDVEAVIDEAITEARNIPKPIILNKAPLVFINELIINHKGDIVMGDKFDIRDSMVGNVKTTGQAIAIQENIKSSPLDFEVLRAEIEKVKSQAGIDSSIAGKLDELLEAVKDKDENEVTQITKGWTQKFKEKILPFLQGAAALASVVGVAVK